MTNNQELSYWLTWERSSEEVLSYSLVCPTHRKVVQGGEKFVWFCSPKLDIVLCHSTPETHALPQSHTLLHLIFGSNVKWSPPHVSGPMLGKQLMALWEFLWLSQAESKNHCQDNNENPGDLLAPWLKKILLSGVCVCWPPILALKWKLF